MAGSKDKKKPGSTTSLARRPRTDSTKAKSNGKTDKKKKHTDPLKMMGVGDCLAGDPCADPKRLDEEIDLERLAEKIFQRLVFEARIERERYGWTV